MQGLQSTWRFMGSMLITHIKGLIFPGIATHEPPSRPKPYTLIESL